MRTGGRRLTAQLLGQMRPLNLEQAMCTRLQAKKEGEYKEFCRKSIKRNNISYANLKEFVYSKKKEECDVC